MHALRCSGGSMRNLLISLLVGVSACASGSAQVETTEPGSIAPTAGGAAGCVNEGPIDAPDTIDGALRIEPGDNPGCFALGDRKDSYALESPPGQFTLYTIEYEGHPNA